MYKRAIVLTSAHPLTTGHAFVIDEALRQSERVKILVLDSDAKWDGSIRMTLDARVATVERFIERHPERQRLGVRGIQGVPVTDALLEEDTFVLIQGVRNDHDLAAERHRETSYRLILPWLKVVTVTPPPELAPVSSSLVRSLIRNRLAEASSLVAMPGLLAQFRSLFLAEQWLGLDRGPSVPDDAFAVFATAWAEFIKSTKPHLPTAIDLDALNVGFPDADPIVRRAQVDRLIRRQLTELRTAKGNHDRRIYAIVYGGTAAERRRWDGGLTLRLECPAPGQIGAVAIDDAGLECHLATRDATHGLPDLASEAYELTKLWSVEGRLP